MLVMNQNPSGRGSQWEIKFSTLYVPGEEGPPQHSGFSLKKLVLEILPLMCKIQKCPMAVIPVLFQLPFFPIQHIQYLHFELCV